MNAAVRDLSLIDPALALRWLHRARRGSLLLQGTVMVLAEVGTGFHLHSPVLVAVLAAWGLLDVFEALLMEKSWRLVAGHAALDLCALTIILSLSGGPSNPLMSAYLVYLALLAIVLPPRWAWPTVGAALLLQLVAVLHPGERLGLPHENLPPGHLAGHVVAFDLAAVAITWFVSRVSAALHEREARERAAAQQRATTERLAALGTLAAGVAHELGTPLGTIQLAAEQLADRIPPEELKLLLEQVDRCRSLLERLRGRESEGPSICTVDLHGWTEEWGRSAPEVAVSVSAPPIAGLQVAGAEESWRAAVWTALDNARKAGARSVWVRLVDPEEPSSSIAVVIEDDGGGVDMVTAARAGEPFRTTWGGTGLGLFVARSFAQSVGGDVILRPGPRGAQVVLTMARTDA